MICNHPVISTVLNIFIGLVVNTCIFICPVVNIFISPYEHHQAPSRPPLTAQTFEPPDKVLERSMSTPTNSLPRYVNTLGEMKIVHKCVVLVCTCSVFTTIYRSVLTIFEVDIILIVDRFLHENVYCIESCILVSPFIIAQILPCCFVHYT